MQNRANEAHYIRRPDVDADVPGCKCGVSLAVIVVGPERGIQLGLVRRTLLADRGSEHFGWPCAVIVGRLKEEDRRFGVLDGSEKTLRNAIMLQDMAAGAKEMNPRTPGMVSAEMSVWIPP